MESVRIVCPSCGETSVFPADWAGTTQQCSRCHVYVDLPSDADHVMGLRIRQPDPQDDDGDVARDDEPADGGAVVLLCPFCDEHAEFDASAAGTTQPCPHCGEALDVLGSLVPKVRGLETVYFRCEWCKKLAQTDADGATYGCECPRCGAVNDVEDVAKNRLTSGQAERMGLLPDSNPET